MSSSPNVKVVQDPETITRKELQQSTKHRKFWALFVSVMFLISTIFLIIVNVGNVSTSPGLPELYMFKLDVTNIIPDSIPNAQLVNSLARTLGLHDFYQVGMWNYCPGYNDEGITTCSTPELLYWFNPVEIITGELLAGATIALPSQVTTYLNIIRLASRIMFGCFFASTMSSFILIFLAPVSLYSRLYTAPICVFALLSAVASVVGAGISTGMWNIFAAAIGHYAADINIVADIGTPMMACQWIAAGASVFGALALLAMTCCGTSRRDIKTGRRISRSRWRKKVVEDEKTGDMPPKRHWFGLKKHTVKV